jgi:16S rRNA (cytidine1402-2'-O)-methyltransferase
MNGTLYIVSTPIGHLADLSHRAGEILASVDLIAAEDTRRTRTLLTHYGIATPVSSYNSFNKLKKGSRFLSLLGEGKDVALVSDAGTPGVSDPLYHLVTSAVAEGIRISPVPGPSALLAALTVSGLPMDRFVFEGFLPRKKGRKKLLQELSTERRTLVLFESPHRIGKTLKELHDALGDRPAALTREMTKIHEEVLRGTLGELASFAAGKTFKGEITLVVGGAPKTPITD